MNSFERWFIKRVIAKEVRQGHHDARVEGLYGLIREAATAEFTEDNAATIDAYLSDRFRAKRITDKPSAHSFGLLLL